MPAAKIDFELRAGNDAPLRLEFDSDTSGTAMDLTGAAFVWSFSWGAAPGAVIRKTTADGSITVTGNAIATTITRAESRLMPLGALTTHELEHRLNGVETSWLVGTVTVQRGINDDA